MNRTASAAAALALACAFNAMPAQAASNRTFVSALGNDANPCSLAAPCRTMQAAFNATTAGGEIEVLDPTGYGSLIITHAVTIEGHGWASMNTSAGGVVITINAGASDFVALRGLVIEGFGLAHNGITLNSSGLFTLQDSVIRDVTISGISIAPSNIMTFTIANTTVSNVGGGQGIKVVTNSAASGTLDHVTGAGNSTGADLEALSSGFLRVTLKDCVFSGNGTGVFLSAPASQVIVTADHSVFANGNTGLHVTNGAAIRLTKNVITGNTNAVVTDNGNGSSVLSYGDNGLDGNTTPAPTLPLISLH